MPRGANTIAGLYASAPRASLACKPSSAAYLQRRVVHLQGDADGQTPKISDAGRKQREGVERQRDDGQEDHGEDGAATRAQPVSLQRVKHDDPALHRETGNRPRRQETAHVRAVGDRLAPAVLVEYVDADPAEPDGEDEHQRDVVDGGQEGEVEAGALVVQTPGRRGKGWSSDGRRKAR